MHDQWEQIAIRNAKVGDTQGWAVLYQGHVTAVFQYALGLTQGRQELAEELTQETFVHAARGLRSYRSRSGTLRMWLFGIAKRRLQKHLTAQNRRLGREKRYAAQQHIPTNENESSTVHEALAHLPGQTRVVLEQKYLHGLSLKEMAETLEISIEAVESRLRRARQQFAQVHQRLTREV